MGKRGPQREPTVKAVKSGKWRGKARAKVEGEVTRTLPVMPESLEGAAVDFWEKYVDGLYNVGVLGAGDGAMFEVLCRTYGEWVDLDEVVRKKGRIVVIDGIPKKNPLLSVLSDVRKDLTRLLREFGMSPSSRAGVELIPVKGKSKKKKSPLGKIT